MITREAVQQMFDALRANTDMAWSVDEVCLWGYFFTDHEEAKLLSLTPALELQGFQIVGICRPTAQDDDQKLLFLHVEKAERHTVDSLMVRNREFYQLAENFGLDSYDGMDVGPVASSGG